MYVNTHIVYVVMHVLVNLNMYGHFNLYRTRKQVSFITVQNLQLKLSLTIILGIVQHLSFHRENSPVAI